MSRNMRLTHLLVAFILTTITACTAVSANYWPMFRHDSYHTGRTNEEGPTSADIVWSVPLGAQCSSSPVIFNDKIYVTTGSHLKAYDTDGNMLWEASHTTSGGSSPAVGTDGTVYVASTDGGLYSHQPDGTFIKKTIIGGYTEASPTVGPDGTVYIGSSTGRFYAYTSSGSLRFQYQAGGAISSSAAIASDGTVYFGCDDGYLYAIKSTGQYKWKFATNQMQPIKSSPVVGADGTIYFGTMSGCLYAVYPTGGQRWQFLAGSGIASSPALGLDGTLYFGCRDRYFYAVNSLGVRKWKYYVGQYVDSSPAIDSLGVIYVGANNGSVYAFQSNGDLKWTTYLGGSVISSPAIGESNDMYVCTTDGFLHAFGNVAMPPTIPVVTDDGAYSTSPSSLHARWLAVDERLGIAKYEYAIGTTPGSEDVVPFTDAGTATEITVSDLTFVNGTRYYFSVRATNNAGLVSQVGVSDGITVDYTPPVTPLVVDDGLLIGSSDTLHFVYSSGDVESGVDYYEYSIGTAPGQQNIFAWNNTGLIKEQTVAGLNLVHGASYFINVRAFNRAGLMSEGCSNGIRVDLSAPVIEAISPTMTNVEIKVRVLSSDPESGVEDIQCALLDSPQLPQTPSWVTGPPDSDIEISGPFDPVKTYYIAARARNGVGRWCDVVISPGIHLDNTPPTTPVVVDQGVFQCDGARISASWSSSDSESGIKSYSYCVGTMPGLANLVDWTDTTETSVTRNGLILTNGGMYYFTVRAINGVGLASVNGFSDGITVDITPPEKPKVSDDGDFTSASDMLHATWSSNDTESGVNEYSYCVGSSPGTDDVWPWTLSGGRSNVTVYDLTLDPNTVYYFSVKARNGGGCWSEIGSSDGIRYIPGASPWPKFRGDSRNSGCSKLNACITGRLRWQLQTQGYVESSPAVGPDGTVYIGVSDGKLYAINSNATVRWTFQTGGCIESSPALGPDASIYVGSHDGFLYCVYPNGTLKWKYGVGGMVWSSPAIGSDGTVYFGCHDNYLYALYPDGRLKWKFKSGGAIWSSPAIADDGTIYFGCGDNNFYSIKPDGTLKWQFITGSAIDSSPAVDTSGAVYFGSGDGNFYALNASGALLWKYYTGRVTDSSPAITPSGRICFGTGAIGTAGEFYSLTSNGRLAWKKSLPGGVRSSPASAADGTIYVGSADGTIYAYNNDGVSVWSYHTGQSILGSPAITPDGSVIVGSDDGKIYSFRDFGGIDITGPSIPKVKAKKVFITPDAPISASWSAVDLESGVQGYSYAIGTSPGSDNVVSWTYVGLDTAINRTGLPLQLAKTYYVSVIASNYASLQSPVGTSSGMTVVSGNPLNIVGETRKRAEGARVYLPGKVVSAVYGDCFFIEEVDRSAGIRCWGSAAGVVVGGVVNVLGTVTNRNGEVTLTDIVVESCGFSVSLKTIAATGRSLAAGGITLSGMLLKVTGKVILSSSDNLVISDGSGQEITVLLQGQKPGNGAYVAVTGVLCNELVNSKPARVIRPTSASSVQTY